MKKLIMITHSSAKAGGSEDDFARLLRYLKGKYEINSVFPEGGRYELFKSLSDNYITPPNRVFPIAKFSLKRYVAFVLFTFIRLFYVFPFLFKNRDSDLCFLNSSVCFSDAVLLTFLGIPYVVSVKEKIYPKIVQKIIYKLLEKTAQRILVISDSLKQEFIKDTNSKKVEIIYSSIESDYYLKTSEKYSADKSDNSGKFIVLNIGNIYEIKGTDVMLKSASHFSKEDNVKIKIIGEFVDEKYRDKLMKLYHRLNLKDVVEFTGSLEKELLIKEITDSDCTVITSKEEGQSLVLLEALLLKKPIISTPVGVVPEVIAHNQNGLIYDFGDDLKIYEYIKKLMNDKILYQKLISNSRDLFYKHFNLEDSLNKYEKVFLEIMENQKL